MTNQSKCWVIITLLAVAACGSDAPEEESHLDQRKNEVLLDSAQQDAAGLTYVTVQPLAPDTLRLTGLMQFDPSRVSHVRPRVQGRIRRVHVEIGSSVRMGDTLAVLDSPELGAAQATWFTAFVRRDVAHRNSERAERLFRDGIVSERRRLEAEGEFRETEARLAAAERALVSLGAEPDSTATSLFVLRAPLKGVVADMHASIGEVVGPDVDMFTVGDLNRLWSILDVYESDLSRVTTGSPVFVTATACPGQHVKGRVTYIGAIVDTTSRTLKVRVELSTQDRCLKPGMFAQTELVLRDDGESIGVPEEAIQSIEGAPVVFIPRGLGRFSTAAVEIGRRRAGGWVEVTNGITLGDTVVAAGSFALKAELLKDSFGEGGD